MKIDHEMKLRLLPCPYSICRSNGKPELPGKVAPLAAVLFDGKTYTWIGPQDSAPEADRVQSGYRALEVQGPLDFSLTGVLAGISSTLAAADVPIFVLSSYDTDYILVHSQHLQNALKALREKGYEIAS